MKDVHFHVLNAIAPDKTNISLEANPRTVVGSGD